MFGLALARNHRGERVIRVRAGQSGDQLVNVMLVIVIAASIGFIGTDVNDSIADSTDTGPLDGEDITVTNESVGAFSWNANDNFLYTVNDADRGATFDDDERAFNSTSGEVLTEGTDYDWFTANATLQLHNTSAINETGDDAVITYNYTEKQSDFSQAETNITGGYADAMSLSDIVFIILLFGVILSVLLAFRMRAP